MITVSRQLIGHHSNVPWATSKQISDWSSSHSCLPINLSMTENLVKIGQVCSEEKKSVRYTNFYKEIFTWIQKWADKTPELLGLNLTKFYRMSAYSMIFSPVHRSYDAPIYSNPFRQCDKWKCRPKTLILPRKLVAMATSLKRLPNEGRIYQPLI